MTVESKSRILVLFHECIRDPLIRIEGKTHSLNGSAFWTWSKTLHTRCIASRLISNLVVSCVVNKRKQGWCQFHRFNSSRRGGTLETERQTLWKHLSLHLTPHCIKPQPRRQLHSSYLIAFLFHHLFLLSNLQDSCIIWLPRQPPPNNCKDTNPQCNPYPWLLDTCTTAIDIRTRRQITMISPLVPYYRISSLLLKSMVLSISHGVYIVE